MNHIIFALVAIGTAVANSLVEAPLQRTTFRAQGGDPSNTAIRLDPGKQFHIKGACRVSSSNSTDTLTPRLRWGTNVLPASNTAIATGGAVDAVNEDIGRIDATLEVQSATRAVLYGRITDVDAANSDLGHDFCTVLTLVPGTDYYLDWTAAWSVANAADIVAAEAFTVVESV